jgi:hypothetical protein
MARRTRRVVTKIDSLSVLRVSLVLYLSIYLVIVVAWSVLWVVATVVGAVDNVENFVEGLFALDSFSFEPFAIFRGLIVGGLIVVMIGSGMNLLLAVLYNLTSDVVGGIEVSVGEEQSEPESAPRERRVRSTR